MIVTDVWNPRDLNYDSDFKNILEHRVYANIEFPIPCDHEIFMNEQEWRKYQKKRNWHTFQIIWRCIMRRSDTSFRARDDLFQQLVARGTLHQVLNSFSWRFRKRKIYLALEDVSYLLSNLLLRPS